MALALTRAVSPRINDCELTHQTRLPIDVALAARQHQAYEDALRELGCVVLQLPPLPDNPDGVFVEDTAVVLDELAVIMRPGAESRRAETVTVAAALEQYRPLRFLEAPATLDGGDVLRIGRTLYVGHSTRSNREGHEQLTSAVATAGYHVRSVDFSGCLHLKSAVSVVADHTLLINPDFIDVDSFGGCDVISVDTAEPYAANSLVIGGDMVFPCAFVRTLAKLEAYGFPIHALDISELLKAEAGVTCCSLIVT